MLHSSLSDGTRHYGEIETYLLLCLFFLSLFFRLWVDILCLFFFFPLGIAVCVNRLIICYLISCMKVFAGLKAGILCSGMIIVVFFEIFLAVF